MEYHISHEPVIDIRMSVVEAKFLRVLKDEFLLLNDLDLYTPEFHLFVTELAECLDNAINNTQRS